MCWLDNLQNVLYVYREIWYNIDITGGVTHVNYKLARSRHLSSVEGSTE